jgi:hypothetical protein
VVFPEWKAPNSGLDRVVAGLCARVIPWDYVLCVFSLPRSKVKCHEKVLRIGLDHDTPLSEFNDLHIYRQEVGGIKVSDIDLQNF